MVAGISLGMLIGIITGIVALLLLRTASRASIGQSKAVLAITAELLAIPTFWFGGPWITAEIVRLVSLDQIKEPYIVSLTVTFVAFVLFPIIRWTIQVGRELGEIPRQEL